MYKKQPDPENVSGWVWKGKMIFLKQVTLLPGHGIGLDSGVLTGAFSREMTNSDISCGNALFRPDPAG